MPADEIITGTCWEDGGIKLMARVLGAAGVKIVQADVTSIRLWSYNDSTAAPNTEIVATGEDLAVGTVIFDTLQTDATWSLDTTGYNFGTTVVPANSILQTAGQYRFEVILTMASGAPIPIVYSVQAAALRSS